MIKLEHLVLVSSEIFSGEIEMRNAERKGRINDV